MRSLRALLISSFAAFSPLPALAVGIWTLLAGNAPDSINNMLLLSDGTILAHDAFTYTDWYRLTPDSHGSYINGTWSALASMNYGRLYYSSQVLTNGQVFVAGGEYGDTVTTNGEIYNPMANTWTILPNTPGYDEFGDSISEILPNGNVLIAPLSPAVSGQTVLWITASNTWSVGPQLYRGGNQDEASWVKLPDTSILTIDPFGNNSERYIPALNEWINDSNVPESLYSNLHELGAAFLLPNGTAFFIGGDGETAIYTPTGTTNPGTWTAGPNIPDNHGVQDAPAAMMVNGKILCCVGTNASTYNPPSYFYEYNYASNSYAAAPSPDNSTPGASLDIMPYECSMLDLPDGTVLMSEDSPQLYIYTPDGTPLAAGQPALTNIILNADGSYQASGILFNGICEGAAYGDDEQMNSNYPLIRMTNSGTGNVYYARTYNWNNTGVMTSNTIVTTQFTAPAGLPAGTYSLVVVANGNSSAPVPFDYLEQASRPVITSVAQNGGTVTFAWTTTTGQPYQAQCATNLTQTNWLNLGSANVAFGSMMSYSDTNAVGSWPRRFYRVASP